MVRTVMQSSVSSRQSSKCLVALILLLPVTCFQLHHCGNSNMIRNTAWADGSTAPPLLPRRTTTALNSITAGALAALDGFFRTCPYTAAALTCGIKASAADLVAQQSTGVDNAMAKTDLRRNVAFGLYGAVYQGAMQEYIYNHLYPVMFGTGTSVSIVLSKVLFDLLVQTTLLTLPVAYLTKALVYQYHPGQAMKLYWNDIRYQALLQKYFLLWGPVQCLTFSIIPEHFRVAFIACVSFFWLIILSKLSSKTQRQFLPTAPVVAVESQLDKLLKGKPIEKAIAAAGE